MRKDDFFEEKSGRGETITRKESKKPPKVSQKGSKKLPYTMNLYLAIALIIAAFFGGFLVRPLALPSTESSIPTESVPTPEAPPLSQEQIQKGQLPAGHPKVNPETSTPSETSTTTTSPSEAP